MQNSTHVNMRLNPQVHDFKKTAKLRNRNEEMQQHRNSKETRAETGVETERERERGGKRKTTPRNIASDKALLVSFCEQSPVRSLGSSMPVVYYTCKICGNRHSRIVRAWRRHLLVPRPDPEPTEPPPPDPAPQ